MNKTAELIFHEAEKKSQSAIGQRVIINRIFRVQDDSDMWPINGRFSVIERAIRQARKFEHDSGCALEPLEYALFLEQAESRIVNDSKNW
jgi:hypothetical protein